MHSQSLKILSILESDLFDTALSVNLQHVNLINDSLLEIVAISPILLAAWQRHTLDGFHILCILTTLALDQYFFIVGTPQPYSTRLSAFVTS